MASGRLLRTGRISAIAIAAALGILSSPVTAHAQPSTLLPLILKPHNADDSGTEIGPNHFALGHKFTENGRWYVTLRLRWETTDGKGLADYCQESSKVVDSQNRVVFERSQRLGGCAYGGNWKFKIFDPGEYRYVLDVAPEAGGSFHAETPFRVDL